MRLRARLHLLSWWLRHRLPCVAFGHRPGVSIVIKRGRLKDILDGTATATESLRCPTCFREVDR